MLESFSCSVGSDSASPWTVTHQTPLSMEFLRQEYWSELSFPSPGDLPDTGIELGSPAFQKDSSPSEATTEVHERRLTLNTSIVLTFF